MPGKVQVARGIRGSRTSNGGGTGWAQCDKHCAATHLEEQHEDGEGNEPGQEAHKLGLHLHNTTHEAETHKPIM
jgi:hypothetical protein